MKFQATLIRPKANEEEKRGYILLTNYLESIEPWAAAQFSRISEDEWFECRVEVRRVLLTKISEISPGDIKEAIEDARKVSPI